VVVADIREDAAQALADEITALIPPLDGLDNLIARRKFEGLGPQPDLTRGGSRSARSNASRAAATAASTSARPPA